MPIAMNSIAAYLPRPTRRWFQLRLRTLLIGLTVVCLILGAFVDRAARERRATEWLAERGFRVIVASSAPDWMPEWLDRKFFKHGLLVDNTSRSSQKSGRQISEYGPIDSQQPISNIELFFLINDSQQAPIPPPFQTELTPALCERLSALRGCRVLSLRQAEIGNDGLWALRRLTRLEYLDLSDCTLRDDDLRHLTGLKQLRILNLRGTGVTDAGLPHLAALTGLRTLYLDGTAVSDAGIEHLKRLAGLWYIKLHQTRVSDRAMDMLAHALPDCSVNGRDSINGW